MMYSPKLLLSKSPIAFFFLIIFIAFDKSENDIPNDKADPSDISFEEKYPGVLLSDIYEVTVTRASGKEKIAVFMNECPEFELGKEDMMPKDRFPLEIFAGRSINWAKFSFIGSVTIEVKVIKQSKVPTGGTVRILPSRHGVTPTVQGNTIRFTINRPGQYSVEIGENGYRNGLMIFADPTETNIPSTNDNSYTVLNNANAAMINEIPSSKSGIYFKAGVHDIGVYKVPTHIKNIYFENGSWVYGALIMDGNPNVSIFGRGVLSSGRLKYRESHCIEAINQSNNITVEGIVVADPKYFAVRLIGQNNNVHWIKVIGGWVYNCDGIAAFAKSNVSNCFIWANDDAIKVYRDDNSWSDIVVWLLNNGGVIQMSWGGSVATNVSIKRVDVLRAEWNKPGFNRALLSCVGNRYQEPGRYGIQKDWLIEDVVTENPIPIIFNITPDAFTPNHIHGLTLKNWNVRMQMGTQYQNMIIGNDPAVFFDGFVFDNFLFNDTKLTESNWLQVTNMHVDRLKTPSFR